MNLSPVPHEPVLIELGDGLVLRGVEPDDGPLVARAGLDPEVRVMSPLRWDEEGSDPIAAALAWCEERGDWSDGTHASWAIAAGGEFAGSISLFKLDFDQLAGEAGYWVLPEFRRRGIASAALRAVAAYGFGPLGLHRIELFHAVENVASCRVAERAGFLGEGLHRQSFRYGDDRYHDEHSHARLSTD
jgi:RimJ/RimL family protein N-acetyltransferase